MSNLKLSKEELKKLILKEIRASLQPSVQPTVWYIRNVQDFRGSRPIGYAISSTKEGATRNFLSRNPGEGDTSLVAERYRESNLRSDLKELDGEMRALRSHDAKIREILQQLNAGQDEY